MPGRGIVHGFRHAAASRPKRDTVSIGRAASIEAVDPEAEQKVYRATVSSELPVLRWFGYEVLSHKRSAIDMTRAKNGLALRDGHFGDQVGLAEGFSVSDAGRGQADLRFSSNARAQEIERDVADKIRTGVSIFYTYSVRALRLLKKGEDGEPNTYLVTRWTPTHVAMDPDPADPTVGVGRSAEQIEIDLSAIPEVDEQTEEGRSMPCKKCQQPTCTGTCEQQPAAVTPAQPAPSITGARGASGDPPAPTITGGDDRGEARRKEIAEIVRTCMAHGRSEQAAEYIEKGLSIGEVSLAILQNRRGGGVATPPAEQPGSGLPAKDRKRFSYARAILAGGDPDKLDGVEKEMHAEIRSKLPVGAPDNGGVYVPLSLEDGGSAEERLMRALDAFMGRGEQSGMRTLDSKTAGAAAEIVVDQYGGLIPLLRKNAVVVKSGARVLNGLTAPVAFSKQTGAGTAVWVGEKPGSDISEADLATGVQMLAPKTIMSATSFSRQLLATATESVEQMVREDLSAIHALAIDKAAYYGIGSAGQPLGVYNAPDVIAKAMGGAGDWVKLVDMVAQCADANALDGTLGWIAQTLLAGRYMTIPRFASTDTPLWVGNFQEGSMVGYPARATSQLSKVMSGSAETGGSSYGLIFGNWADLIIGMWGAMEMISDPYAKKKQGLIEVATFQMTDVMLRHGESFVKATGATLA